MSFQEFIKVSKITKNVLSSIFIIPLKLLSLQKIIKLNLFIQLPQVILEIMVETRTCHHMHGRNLKI